MDLKHLEFWQLLLIVGLISGVVLTIVYWILFKGRFSIKKGDTSLVVNPKERPELPTIATSQIKPTGVCVDCKMVPHINSVIDHVFSSAVDMTKMELVGTLDKQTRYARTRVMMHLGQVLEAYKSALVESCEIKDPQFHTDYLFVRPLIIELLEKVVRHLTKALEYNGLLEYSESDYRDYIANQISNTTRYFTEFLDTRYMGERVISRERLNQLTNDIEPSFGDTIKDIFVEARSIAGKKEDQIRQKELELITFIQDNLGLEIKGFEVKK